MPVPEMIVVRYTLIFNYVVLHCVVIVFVSLIIHYFINSLILTLHCILLNVSVFRQTILNRYFWWLVTYKIHHCAGSCFLLNVATGRGHGTGRTAH